MVLLLSRLPLTRKPLITKKPHTPNLDKGIAIENSTGYGLLDKVLACEIITKEANKNLKKSKLFLWLRLLLI
jgi:hypothetical protein